MVYLIAKRRNQFLMEHVLPPSGKQAIYLLARLHFPLQTVQMQNEH